MPRTAGTSSLPRRSSARTGGRYGAGKASAQGAKIAAVAVAVLLAFMGVWIAMASGTEEPPPPQPVEQAPPPSEEEVPGAYLFQHFLGELHDCYRQIGQSISLPNLERQVGKEWGAAAVALMDYYRDGKCAEGDRYLRIPGRAAWMIEQVQETAVGPAGEDEE